jgi:hypothetical protein
VRGTMKKKDKQMGGFPTISGYQLPADPMGHDPYVLTVMMHHALLGVTRACLILAPPCGAGNDPLCPQGSHCQHCPPHQCAPRSSSISTNSCFRLKNLVGVGGRWTALPAFATAFILPTGSIVHSKDAKEQFM